MASLTQEVNIELDVDELAELLRSELSEQQIADEFCLYTEEEHREGLDEKEEEIDSLRQEVDSLEHELSKVAGERDKLLMFTNL